MFGSGFAAGGEAAGVEAGEGGAADWPAEGATPRADGGELAAAVGERVVPDAVGEVERPDAEPWLGAAAAEGPCVDEAPSEPEGEGGGIVIVPVGPGLPPECTISTRTLRNRSTAATAPTRRNASGSLPPRYAMASLVLVGYRARV